MERELLELALDEGLSLEEMGETLGTGVATVSFWLGVHGLEPADPHKHAPKGGIDRDRLTSLVDAGMSIAKIAREVGMSKATVRYWMRRYGLRTRNAVDSPSAQAARAARANGVKTVVMTCQQHGETEFVLEGRGYHRCKRCRVESVVRRRRKVKAILVEEAGGRCRICGYDACVGALEFHHIDPAEKLLEVSRHGVTLALKKARAEARKCVLLCSNCHVEVEAGITTIPAKVLAEYTRQT